MNLSYNEFNSSLAVSRETYVKLEAYVSLLKKWQNSINLISNSTLPDIWNRHIIDSYQLVSRIDSSENIMDIGSGAGLPGLVLAIAGAPVTLVESDGKKVAFLREVVRQLDLNVTICHQRIEDVSLSDTSTVTARACASVLSLIDMLAPTLTASHKLLLLKGKSYREELAEAEKRYDFKTDIHPSITDPSGVVLILTDIHQRGAHRHE